MSIRNVRLTVSDDAHERLQTASDVAGYPSISTYVLSLSGVDTPAVVEARKCVEAAHRCFAPGVAFNLREVVDQEIPKSQRTVIGKSFAKIVRHDVNCGIVEEFASDGSGPAIYRIIKAPSTTPIEPVCKVIPDSLVPENVFHECVDKELELDELINKTAAALAVYKAAARRNKARKAKAAAEIERKFAAGPKV